MSFADFGFEIFPFHRVQNRINVICSCGDYSATLVSSPADKHSNSLLEDSCYQLIIDHLIYLGTCTENELALVQSELKKYRKLHLSEEQLNSLRSDPDCARLQDISCCNSSKFKNLCDGDYGDRWRIFTDCEEPGLISPRENEWKKICGMCSSRKGQNEAPISKENFRAVIIQKDSEIISLKNDKAVKETEVQELEEEKRSLEMEMDKMRTDIDLLESSSRISRTSIEEVIRQKNEEFVALRQNSDMMEERLCLEHEARISAEQRLQTIVGEIQALQKNFNEEAKTAKRRIQALEESNTSQSATIQQLQRQRESLERQNLEQENEIEKLLSITKRLNEKHCRSKMELSASERRVTQCKEQLENVEREVSRLIAELTDCLGRVDPTCVVEPAEIDLYARAGQLTRGLSKFVKEHGTCQADRQNLLLQIDRLQARDCDRPLASLTDPASGDLQCLVDDLLSRLDEGHPFERGNQAYLRVAGEASLALQKLEQSIDEHHVYKRCENFLLLELENLQDALDGAERTIKGLECKKTSTQMELVSDYSGLEAVMSKKILERVQNSTQIVIRITTALHDESKLRTTYSRNLEDQLEQAIRALNQLGAQNCRLQSDYEQSEDKRKELEHQVDRLKSSLASLSEELDSRRAQLASAEAKLQTSRSENLALIAKSDEMIESLQRELQNREAKLRDYGRFNDFLNGKLEESNRMIEQLQASMVRESLRKLDLDSFTALHERILELVAEKDELTDKIGFLQSQLASYERGNAKLQNNLAEIDRDNEELEAAVRSFKCENERFASHMSRKSNAEIANIRAKCDEVFERLAKLSRESRTTSSRHGGVTEIKAHKDKLCYQEKELMMKEREIAEMQTNIEALNAEIAALRERENSCNLLKCIEVLTREKSELKDELKQTLAKYEDKLAEMHRQYKQSELELHRKHSESIRRLEAKYTEMMREEAGDFDPQSWLQSLSPKAQQELHDRICKTPLCSASNYEKELYEEQQKRNLAGKSSSANYGIKVSLQARKEQARSMKTSSSNYVKPSSARPRTSSVRESASNQSLVFPEKDQNHQRPGSRLK